MFTLRASSSHKADRVVNRRTTPATTATTVTATISTRTVDGSSPVTVTAQQRSARVGRPPATERGVDGHGCAPRWRGSGVAWSGPDGGLHYNPGAPSYARCPTPRLDPVPAR